MEPPMEPPDGLFVQLVMYYIWHKLPPKHRPYKHARGICISPYVGPYSYGEMNCDGLHILMAVAI